MILVPLRNLFCICFLLFCFASLEGLVISDRSSIPRPQSNLTTKTFWSHHQSHYLHQGDYDAHDYWPAKTFEILTTGQLHNCIALNIVLEHCTTYCNSCLNPSLSVFINNFVFINNLFLIKSFVFINDFVFINNFDDEINIVFINNFSTTLQLLDC